MISFGSLQIKIICDVLSEAIIECGYEIVFLIFGSFK